MQASGAGRGGVIRAGAVLLALVPWLGGCPPSCEQVCDKLDTCKLNDDVPELQCTTTCRRELAAYQDDGDQVREQAFDAQRWCIGQNTCAELAAGACFDDLLFPIDPVAGG